MEVEIIEEKINFNGFICGRWDEIVAYTQYIQGCVIWAREKKGICIIKASRQKQTMTNILSTVLG